MLGPLPCPWDAPSAHRCSGWSHFQSLSLERALRSEITWLVQPEPLYNSQTQRAGGEEAEIHTLSLRRQDKPPREVPSLIKPATYQSGGAASTSLPSLGCGPLQISPEELPEVSRQQRSATAFAGWDRKSARPGLATSGLLPRDFYLCICSNKLEHANVPQFIF